MTVPVQTPIISYVANGISTLFAFPFEILESADLVVLVDGVTASLGTSYSLNGVGSASGGSVQFGTAPATGAKIIIYRDISIERDTDYQDNGDLLADTVNADFDRIWMALQDINGRSTRAIQYPVTEYATDGTLPVASERVNTMLGFDANGAQTLLSIPASVGAGDLKVEEWADGVDYTAGTSTSVTLSRTYGTKANLGSVVMQGIAQDPTSYSLSGTTLTFDAPIPLGVSKIWCTGGTTLSIYLPPDASVGDDQLQWGTILPRAVDSIAALRVLACGTYKRAHVFGYYTPGDGGGGDYYYSPTADPVYDNGGTIIAAAGGVGCWLMRTDRVISVKQFGAKGDWNGTTGTNDSTAFQNAINFCQNNKLSLYVPGGAPTASAAPNFGYCVKGLTITAAITIFGEATSHNMPQLNLWDGSDTQMFNIVAPGVTLRGLSILGSATASTQNQHLIYVQNVNEFQLEDCVLAGGYNNIYIDGTSFYNSFLNSKFGTAVNSWFKINSTTGGGVDFIMDNCRGISSGSMLDSGLRFTGLGSCIVSNCAFTPNTGDFTALKVYTVASAFGLAQFNNCVFETALNKPGVWLVGTVSTPIRFFKFTNCYSLGSPALRVDHGYSTIYNDGYLTGGNNAVLITGEMNGLTLDNVDFQVNGNVINIQSGATNLTMHIRDPWYIGLGVFLLGNAVPASSWNWLQIKGGFVGLNGSPIALTDFNNTPKDIEARGVNGGVKQRLIITGNLVSGAGTFPHGLNSASARVVSLHAWAKKTAGQATPIDQYVTVDDTNVVISGSGAGNVYVRIILEYINSDTNW